MKHDFLTVNYPKIIHVIECTQLNQLGNPLLFPSIILVKEGHLTISTPEHDFLIQKGDIFVVATNTPFSCHSESSFNLVCLTFYESTPYFEKLFVEEHQITPLFQLNTDIHELWNNISELYRRYEMDSQLKRKLMLDAQLMTLLSQLLPSQIHQKEERYIDKDLQKAIDYFSDYYAQPIKISDVAVMIGLHPNYFTKKFKEYYGLSPKAFLTSIRLKKASVLMRSTDLSLKEIAKTVGYHDYLTFRKAFKKNYQNNSPRNFVD